MTTTAKPAQQQTPRILAKPDVLSCLTFRLAGPGARTGVGVAVGLAVRLDTDTQTDPLRDLTGQVSRHHSGRRSIQTDPSWGLPHRGAHEHIH